MRKVQWHTQIFSMERGGYNNNDTYIYIYIFIKICHLTIFNYFREFKK